MKKVHILKCHNIQKNYTLENRVYTTKNKALNSRLKLIEYLCIKHNLNSENIEVSWQDDDISILILDQIFALEVKSYHVTSEVSKYM
tara:strand:- start:109 stop:369 length:261 start_codon:yes stop_codon:yes gene_type:complete